MGHTPFRSASPAPRAWRWLSALVALAMAVLATPSAAVGQIRGSGPLAVYFGEVELDRAPAPSGTPVLVVTAPSATEVHYCGETTTGGDGAYRVEVRRSPECASPRPGPGVQHIFIVNGMQFSQVSPAGYIDSPTVTLRKSFNGPLIPGYPRGGSAPPMLRFYGLATVSGEAAPPGTAITVFTLQRNTEVQQCATGQVGPAGGWYWVDAPAIAACAHRSAGPGVQFRFEMLGERWVPNAAFSPAPALTTPSNVGHKHRVDLEVKSPIGKRVAVEGDAQLFAQAFDCFRQMRRLANQAPTTDVRGAMLRELLATLDGAGATAPTGVVIQPLPITDLGPNTAAPSNWRTWLADRPANATIKIHPEGLDKYFEPLIAAGLRLPTAGTFCDTLVHELTHAAEFMTGTLSDYECQLAEGPLRGAEIVAMAVENAFRGLDGRQPIALYPNPNGLIPLGYTLPDDAIHPTWDFWRRYGEGNICP